MGRQRYTHRVVRQRCDHDSRSRCDGSRLRYLVSRRYDLHRLHHPVLKQHLDHAVATRWQPISNDKAGQLMKVDSMLDYWKDLRDTFAAGALAQRWIGDLTNASRYEGIALTLGNCVSSAGRCYVAHGPTPTVCQDTHEK